MKNVPKASKDEIQFEWDEKRKEFIRYKVVRRRYLIGCTETDDLKIVSLKQILNLIRYNGRKYHGAEWQYYDETDWEEGLERFTSWKLFVCVPSLVEINEQGEQV